MKNDFPLQGTACTAFILLPGTWALCISTWYLVPVERGTDGNAHALLVQVQVVAKYFFGIPSFVYQVQVPVWRPC